MSRNRCLVHCLLVVAIGLCAAAPARSQEVRWHDPGPLGLGQDATLELVFSGTRPDGTPKLPAIDGLKILGSPSESSSHSIVNLRMSSSYTLRYRVRPSRRGEIRIPEFQVKTRKGVETVSGLRLEVGDAAIADAHGRRTPVSDVVDAYLTPSSRRPYAGEVFDVEYLVTLAKGRSGELVNAPEWQHPGLVAEDWGEGEQVRVGGGRAGMRFRARAMAREAGRIALPPALQELQVDTGRMRRGFPFSQPERANVTAASDAVAIDVRELPAPAPPGFAGATGRFRLESKLVPAEVAAGEPVTWTLTLAGKGNWPAGVGLPARAIPADLRALQPKAVREFAENELFSGSITEDVVLIPEQAGELTLDPVEFVYFDPETGHYQTAIVRPPTLRVTSPIATQGAPAPPRSGAIAVRPQVPQPAPPEDQPLLQDTPRLPRDSLAASSRAFAPARARSVAMLAGLPPLLLAFYWGGLALRRARLRDPRRPQREALADLAEAIEAARGSRDAQDLTDALLRWQRASAVVLGVGLAAPTAAQLRTLRDPSVTTSELRERWADAWTESDRAVWAARGELAEGWCERASLLCRGVRLPRWNPLRAFLPANLLPPAVTAAALLVALALPTPVAAAEPLAAYQRGDFAKAAEGFRAQVVADPDDWVAHYNLGLAHAQLREPGRAFGETAAAFLRRPRDESVRWNLALFARGLPRLDPSLAVLVAPGPLRALARSGSPAAWQAGLVLASTLFCLGSALALQRRYAGRPGGRGSWLRSALLAAGLALAAVSSTAIVQYGVLAGRDVAMVVSDTPLRSVPTDAETPQAQKALPAGAIVTLERDFLGWVQVVRPSGERGWMRRGQLVPLYGAPG